MGKGKELDPTNASADVLADTSVVCQLTRQWCVNQHVRQRWILTTFTKTWSNVFIYAYLVVYGLQSVVVCLEKTILAILCMFVHTNLTRQIPTLTKSTFYRCTALCRYIFSHYRPPLDASEIQSKDQVLF